ncbi:MAG TPA: VOC family protein [Steroidobacteraceae bacterium]|nr:VOC family protein [Steroidobacteraceae bacterium]
MQLENHYQNAYVTSDLDRALEIFRTQYGFDGFKRIEVSYELTTPAGRGSASVKLALGWIGSLQYELIQPVSGLIDVYREGLDARSPMRFHHVCMRVPDWTEFRARVDREKRSVVMEGGTPGHLLWLYVDARDSLGHYLEYCWMTPERWAMIGGR